MSEQLKTAVHALKISACFRPLSGIKVSEQATYQMVHLTMVCFRPLAGSQVSEHQRQRLHLNQNRFRPLAGSKVSEPLKQGNYTKYVGFPSPFGD